MFKLRLIKQTDRGNVGYYLEKEKGKNIWIHHQDVKSFEEGKNIIELQKRNDEIVKNIKTEVVYE